MTTTDHENFYITQTDAGAKQLEFDYDRQQSKDVMINDCENPVYRSDSPEDDRTHQIRDTTKTTVSSSPDLFLNNSLKYGWGPISPKWMQFFNKPIFFMVCLSTMGVAQGLVVTGVAFTILTSIEKQFGMSSTHVALFGTSYDVAYGVFCALVGYIGHKHKPRWLGIGLMVMAIGAFIASMPKYIIGEYKAGIQAKTDVCRLSPISAPSSECGGAADWYYTLIFITGNVLLGIGATPIYVLGPAHIDEITTRGQNSLYTGIFFGSAALGPALGFIIGLPILNTWVDLKQVRNDCNYSLKSLMYYALC